MKKWSKWIPLAFYGFDGSIFFIQTRKNLKNGMVCFKVKKVNKSFTLWYSMPMLDIDNQFNILMEQE